MDVEDRYKEMEKKTEKLTRLLDDLTREFDELQEAVDGSSSECFVPNKRINMDGSKEENEKLVTGWHAAEKGFRWGGKNREYPTVYFRVSPERPYMLDMKIFIPREIAGSPIRILVNDVEISSFVSEGGQLKKSIYIPSDLIATSRLKVIFKSDFWDPAKIDRALGSRIISMAFNYLELKEL